jgi:photosystem II stability/assembly factor-like uncharacterized protein
MANIPLTAGMGAIWLQFDPNTEPVYLGCHNISDIKQKKGDKTLIWCKDASGPNRFVVAGSYRGAQDPATFTLETLVHDTGDYLETIEDQTVTVIINKYVSGRADQFTNYVRRNVLRGTTITQETESGVANRDPKDNTASMESFEMSAEDWFRVMPLTAKRQSTSEVNNANVIRFFDPDTGYIGCKAVALGTANLLVTTNGGGTWAASAADPFAADEDIIGMAVFEVDANTHRVLVVRDDDAAAGLKVAYSDNSGTSWSTVTAGGPNATKALGQAALFALDFHHIWLVAKGGYIFFSADGGASWVTQDAGVTTTADLYAVHFIDSKNGIATGATDKILTTADGGTSWALVTATGGGDTVASCHMIDPDVLWVGTIESGGSDNSLYYSEDGGTTWSTRTFSGSDTGKILAIEFIDDQIGFLAHQTTAPVGTIFRTCDGGFTWESISTPTNAGITSLDAMNNNRVSVCGPASGGTAYIARATNLLGGE